MEEVTTALTIQDVLGVAGVALAATGLGMSVGLAKARSLRRRLEAVETQVAQANSDACMLALIVERGLAGTMNAVDFEGGLLQRVAERRCDEVNLGACMAQLSRFKRTIERCWQEARVMAHRGSQAPSEFELLRTRLETEHTEQVRGEGSRPWWFDSARSAGAAEARDESRGGARQEQ